MSRPTADLCDAHPQLQVLDAQFRDYGALPGFAGPIATLKVYEDNRLVRAALEQPGGGRVLVVDGGGSRRCALFGGQLGELAVRNGWAGVLIWGCVRDCVELRDMAVGIRAIGSHPRRSTRGLHEGQSELDLHFAGVHFRPGAYLYADADGIVLSEHELPA